MSVTNVRSRWVNGNLVFYDSSEAIICTFDGTNRALTFPSGSALNLPDGNVEAADIALAEGSVVVGNNAGAGVALDASTTTQFLVGNGTTLTSVAMSNHATMANTGAVTLEADSVDSAELTAAAVDLAHFGTDTNTWLNAIRTYLADGMLTIATIVISAAAEKFKTTTTTIVQIAGLAYSKVATDNLVFSGTSTINTAGAAGTTHWGVFLVQMDAALTVSTLPGTYTSGSDQDYASEAAAIAVLPAVTASNVQLGYITVQGKTSTGWIEATSDMTAGGDCETSTFYDLPAAKTLPAVLT